MVAAYCQLMSKNIFITSRELNVCQPQANKNRPQSCEFSNLRACVCVCVSVKKDILTEDKFDITFPLCIPGNCCSQMPNKICISGLAFLAGTLDFRDFCIDSVRIFRKLPQENTCNWCGRVMISIVPKAMGVYSSIAQCHHLHTVNHTYCTIPSFGDSNVVIESMCWQVISPFWLLLF